ncbi:MAG: thrombospondin type 3 repeat-containing protein [Kiritimatiellae bacterium]|nr:thrombospondin type 3 repeat-containing protein [Kiritimatiellia bacterium]
MKNTIRCVALSVAVAGLFTPLTPVSANSMATPLPPHVYTGRVLDYDAGNLATTRYAAEVRARGADGTLLARCKVTKVEGTLSNYALSIPVSSIPTPQSAVSGERLSFEVDNGVETFVISNAFPAVGLPGRVSRVDMVAARDTNRNGFADAYEEDIAAYMAVMGFEGPLNPHGDYDNDGMSNYDEYLAGTDPLSDADCLRFISLESVAENPDVLAAGFLPGMNRSYSVQGATNTVAHRGFAFQPRAHQIAPELNAAKSAYLQTGSESPRVQLLYLIKEGDHALYRLRLE